MENTGLVILQTALEDKETARSLARRIVGKKLAACVQVSAIESFYEWDGKPQEEPEFLLSCKLATDRVEALQNWLETNHPYDTPEIITLPVIGVNDAYKEWLIHSLAH